jgi:hypothetical protein
MFRLAVASFVVYLPEARACREPTFRRVLNSRYLVAFVVYITGDGCVLKLSPCSPEPGEVSWQSAETSPGGVRRLQRADVLP